MKGGVARAAVAQLGLMRRTGGHGMPWMNDDGAGTDALARRREMCGEIRKVNVKFNV